MPAREYSDEALMQQLAGFLSYEYRGGGLCFTDWADGKDFAPGDRNYLEVAYMAATVGTAQ